MSRSGLITISILMLFPSLALGHGGSWRGPGSRAPGDPSPGDSPGPSSWTSTWRLNREALLDLRGLQAQRLKASTPAASPHFFGESGGRDLPSPEGESAVWNGLLDTLMKAARDRNADVGTGAVIALGKAGDPRARPLLMELVDDADAHFTVNESAALAVGMIGGGLPERRFLERVMGDGKAGTRTRAFAALGLGFLGDVGALPALMAQAKAKEPSRDVPTCAILAMGLLGEAMIVPDLSRRLAGAEGLREQDDYLRAWYSASIAKIGAPSGLPAVLSSFSDGYVEVRRQAAFSAPALADAGNAEAVQALIEASRNDRDNGVKAFAALALGQLGTPLAWPELQRAYEQGVPIVKPYAAMAIGFLARSLPDPEQQVTVVRFLRREFQVASALEVRGSLAIALGIAGDTESIPALLKVLEGKGAPDPRAHVAVALGLIGGEAARPALRRVLTERSDPTLQREAALALGLLGDRGAVDILLALVKDGSSEYVRGSAAVALGRLATVETAGVLREIVEDAAGPATTRAFACVALGLVMDRRPEPILAKISHHLNHSMAAEAVLEALSIL
jgi:HEAT repeat protein